MMYVSVYPIALSVRSTNVYEERSLGVFDPQDEEEDKDLGPEELQQGRGKVWGRYIAMHARKQLAFGELLALLAQVRCADRTNYRYLVVGVRSMAGGEFQVTHRESISAC